jgi:hypothetical protein
VNRAGLTTGKILEEPVGVDKLYHDEELS